jgi:hypothetical protein
MWGEAGTPEGVKLGGEHVCERPDLGVEVDDNLTPPPRCTFCTENH